MVLTRPYFPAPEPLAPPALVPAPAPASTCRSLSSSAASALNSAALLSNSARVLVTISVVCRPVPDTRAVALHPVPAPPRDSLNFAASALPS